MIQTRVAFGLCAIDEASLVTNLDYVTFTNSCVALEKHLTYFIWELGMLADMRS
jgi:hypothetical protein